MSKDVNRPGVFFCGWEVCKENNIDPKTIFLFNGLRIIGGCQNCLLSV